MTFDRGSGPPLVVIPGLHGRWEWATPALARLSGSCRTISYSLCGDLGSGRRLDRTLGFENYLRQLDAVLDDAGVPKAALCGVSFGGYVALHYAARRADRVSALVLASAPGPRWNPTAQQARWLSRPWVSAPAFVLSSPARIWPEVSKALPDWPERLRFFVAQTARCAAAPMIPGLMAARIHCTSGIDFEADCRRIQASTLVLTGEEGLDRVVPVASTRAYASLIPGAEYRMLPNTGHMGFLTRPDIFAEVVTRFVHANHH
jgi:pimeloyl-ACP methyl ester carboxylesterase